MPVEKLFVDNTNSSFSKCMSKTNFPLLSNKNIFPTLVALNTINSDAGLGYTVKSFFFCNSEISVLIHDTFNETIFPTNEYYPFEKTI